MFAGGKPAIDLLRAIRIPFRSPGIDYIGGRDGFPAFWLSEGADVKAPFRLHLPASLPADFAIAATVKPERANDAFIFAVVNPSETVIQLGLQLSHHGGRANLTLLYTDVDMHLSSQELATFSIPDVAFTWARFLLTAEQDNITLYLNCQPVGSQVVQRIPRSLTFDTASTLYIGQAGPLLGGHYKVRTPLF
ncbi:hypothetical protein LAZ67_4000780 [Cordylochernes scorpioides]|uniref:Thrombospondin-like N-terminal domain-containing protein n=1 Tax=Cordylochernes scorpioides TaxID=51811 RepID=A0ABY6KEK9_9ARAC|nr:hypothetical protein LAZ67_4000780 [Cordylochernes scorpioides]